MRAEWLFPEAVLEHGFGRFNSLRKLVFNYFTTIWDWGVFMEMQERFTEITGDGVFCLICKQDSYALDVCAVMRLLARTYPEELAQVCARPYGETTEEWVGMMAEGRCPGIEAGYVPASRSAPKGAERK